MEGDGRVGERRGEREKGEMREDRSAPRREILATPMK